MRFLRYHEREWRFDPATRELVERCDVRVSLCSERRPVEGARPVLRIGEHEWQIAPAVYRSGFFKRVDDDFICLLNAPDDVCEQLRVLL